MSPVAIHPRRTFVRQHSVFLPNRVGAFSSLVSLLSQGNINLIGLSVQDSRDATVARLVLDDPDRAEEIFLERGIPYTTCELVVAKIKDCQEGLRTCLATLLKAETNIDFTYALLTQHEGCSLLAMHLEDAFFGAEVLHRAGITLCYEEDLLR
ncbi:MAG: hypothetical protein ACQKBY_09530 [Verrucomicrobiales bacterium]